MQPRVILSLVNWSRGTSRQLAQGCSNPPEVEEDFQQSVLPALQKMGRLANFTFAILGCKLKAVHASCLGMDKIINPSLNGWSGKFGLHGQETLNAHSPPSTRHLPEHKELQATSRLLCGRSRGQSRKGSGRQAACRWSLGFCCSFGPLVGLLWDVFFSNK